MNKEPAKREHLISDSEDDEVDEAPATSSTSWCKWTNVFFFILQANEWLF